MAQREKQFSAGTCAHGYAGIASTFAALANRKLKPGGVLALVLPLSAATGVSWQMFRQMLETEYAGLDVLSISTGDNDELSFSADTGMAECLVIARKKTKEDKVLITRVHFSSLRRRPQGFAPATPIAQQITGSDPVRRVEDGPAGGTEIVIGDESAGEMITAPVNMDGNPWAGVRLSDYALAQTAYGLVTGCHLGLPGAAGEEQLVTVPLTEVGNRGFYDMNIAGNSGAAPFDKTNPSQTSTYPSLWNHNAKLETRIVCEPDAQLRIKLGMEAKAATVWATAGHTYFNRDFRFNSQPLAVAYTLRKSIGGRAWPNITFPDDRFYFAFALWSNCTLGLLLHWWSSSRQVAGRGTITISAIESFPVLDFRTLTDEQLATAEEIFEEFRDKELKPAYLADTDPNRALLDRRVVCDLLGFGDDVYEGVRRLAAKWCAEPSVHGGKKRPKGAGLVI